MHVCFVIAPRVCAIPTILPPCFESWFENYKLGVILAAHDAVRPVSLFFFVLNSWGVAYVQVRFIYSLEFTVHRNKGRAHVETKNYLDNNKEQRKYLCRLLHAYWFSNWMNTENIENRSLSSLVNWPRESLLAQRNDGARVDTRQLHSLHTHALHEKHEVRAFRSLLHTRKL